MSAVSTNHVCMDINKETAIVPRKWRENVLNCRVCKRKLVIFLGQYFLHNCSTFLEGSQTLYIAGTFTGVIEDCMVCN